MTGLPSASHLPRYAGRVPQLVRYGLAKEIHRCLRVLRFLGGLNARDLIRSRPPRANARLLSVVVPMRNARDWIEPCLKSVLAQTHSDLEIFCVDDCSTDDTYGRVVDQFGRDRRLCVIRLGKNAGPYQIKNWVIHALARARLVALQDADDVSHPTRLAEQKQWMVRHRLSIGGTSVHQFFPPHIEPMVGTVDRVEVNGVRHSLAVYASVRRTRAPILVKEMLWERKVERFMNRHSSMAFYGAQILARDVFLEFGGFDGHTRVGADKDFNWRLVRFHSIGNLLKVLYSRRIHDLSLTQDPLTGYNSALRARYAARRRRDENVRRELLTKNMDKVRELCTSDLFYGDIEIEETHTGFDVDLTV